MTSHPRTYRILFLRKGPSVVEIDSFFAFSDRVLVYLLPRVARMHLDLHPSSHCCYSVALPNAVVSDGESPTDWHLL